MTRRERIYHWRKSSYGKWRIALNEKLVEAYLHTGRMGFRAFVGEDGVMRVETLTPLEILEIVDGGQIPEETTILPPI